MVERHRTPPVPVSDSGTLTASRSPSGDAGEIANFGESFKGPPKNFSAKELGRLGGQPPRSERLMRVTMPSQSCSSLAG